jgi:Domain of unknown function (DUF4313)
MFVKKLKYKEWNCSLVKEHYAYGGRVVLFLNDAENGEPIATCTTNVPKEPLAVDEVFIKNYSENEGMLDFLVNAGVVKDTGRRIKSGYVEIPVCKLLV